MDTRQDGVTRNAYTIMVGKLLGKRSFGRLRRRWEERGSEYQRWMELA
jgi:hypothetical protein